MGQTEDFQGQESKIVLISTVLSERHASEMRERLGLLGHPKRVRRRRRRRIRRRRRKRKGRRRRIRRRIRRRRRRRIKRRRRRIRRRRRRRRSALCLNKAWRAAWLVVVGGGSSMWR